MYGLTDAGGAAASLAEGIRRALAPIVPRVDDGSPFQPHVTLARARAERGLDLASWMAGRAVPSGCSARTCDPVPITSRPRPGALRAAGSGDGWHGAHIVRNVEAEASVQNEARTPRAFLTNQWWP